MAVQERSTAAGVRWKRYWAAVLALGVLYVAVDGEVYGTRFGSHSNLFIEQLATVQSQPTASAATAWPPSGDVPDPVVSAIVNRLGNVTGLNDMVVLPDQAVNAYTVSAMVDLGDVSAASIAPWNPTVDKDVDQYFQDVFTGTPQVNEAEIYFTQNGQVVASAGLGRQTYEQLTTTADTASGGLASVLASMPVASGGDLNNHWFQVADGQSNTAP